MWLYTITSINLKSWGFGDGTSKTEAKVIITGRRWWSPSWWRWTTFLWRTSWSISLILFLFNDKLFKRCFMNWILFSLPLDFVQLEQFFLLSKVAIWWLQGNTTAQTAHCAFNLCFVPDPPSLNIFALGPLWSNNMQNSFPRANGFESNHERGSLKGREWYFLSIEPHLHAS